MIREVLKYLDVKEGKKFVDCTLGGAGYTIALAEQTGVRGKVLGIDLDRLALDNAQQIIKQKKIKNIVLVQGNFKNLENIVSENFKEGMKFDGIVFDLGLSSAQLADETRGFSFKGEHPLDMAFGPDNDKSSADILNYYSLLELTKIFQEYGEEKHGYRIARAIIEARKTKKLETTVDLVNIIEKIIPFRFRSKIHPATKIFQALRMETNEELSCLESVLPVAVKLLKKGGRIVVVSFHSGEDRIVKRFFKNSSELTILTKRPLIPEEDELTSNPRARSAKFRAAEKN